MSHWGKLFYYKV